MNFHLKIVLIYAHLSLKCHELNLRAFLIQKLGFFPSLCLSNARLFSNMGPVGRIGTTAYYYPRVISIMRSVNFCVVNISQQTYFPKLT